MASRDRSWAEVRSWWPPVLAIGGALALWLLLSFANRGTTYHFAPLIVAAAGPVTARLDAAAALPWRHVVALAAGSVTAATLGIALLWPLGALNGPVVLGSSAPAETMVAIAVGATAGLLVGRFPGRVDRRATSALDPPRHGDDS